MKSGQHFFFWPVEWKLSNVPANTKVENGAVVQFVKINFNLKWVNRKNQTRDIRDPEILNKANFHNPSGYVEVWPIAGIQPDGRLIPDMPDKYTKDAAGAPVTLKSLVDEGYSSADVAKVVTSHDVFGASVEKQFDNLTLKGTIGIEGFAFYVNQINWRVRPSGAAWDGQSIMLSAQLPIPGGKTYPLNRVTERPSVFLLSNPFNTPGFSSMALTWDKAFKPIVDAQNINGRFVTAGLYRKIVVEVDTKKAPSSKLLLNREFAVDRKDLDSFMKGFAAVPLVYTAVPADVRQVQAMLALSGIQSFNK